MVGVNPVLRCLMGLEESIVRGDSVRDSLMQWLDLETRKAASGESAAALDREFIKEAMEFLRRSEDVDQTGHPLDVSDLRCRTVYRESLFIILSDGILGNAILPRMRELRTEIEAQLELDLKAHVDSLPLKMLVPLLLFMFPSFLILLLGPITRNFVEALR